MDQPKIISIAWYKKDQWDRIRAVSSDKDSMDEEYEDWERRATKQVNQARRNGFDVRCTEIDVDALLAWTRRKGLDINGVTRADFANLLLAKSLGLNADI